MPTTQMDIIGSVNALRDQLRIDCERVINLKNHSIFTSAEKGDPNSKSNYSEMIANIMLTYRHLEDARMRLGKVVQAHNGGESIYDKDKK